MIFKPISRPSSCFLWKSRLGVGVESRRKIMHIFELFDFFVLAVTYKSRTLQSELKTCKTQLSEMNDSC